MSARLAIALGMIVATFVTQGGERYETVRMVAPLLILVTWAALSSVADRKTKAKTPADPDAPWRQAADER